MRAESSAGDEGGKRGGGGWLVAPKIARINIRARHCHSVNFPRCWLYPRQKEGRVRFCSWRRNTEGVRGGGRREKHRYPFPSLPFPSLDGILCAPRFRRCAHTWRSTAFSLHPSSPLLPPLVHPYALLRRYTIGQHRQMHMHLRMENWWRGKKKITTEQTIRVTWTTATNNVGLVNELSRQKLQLLRVQEVWEPGKWIPCRPMTRDGRENNC